MVKNKDFEHRDVCNRVADFFKKEGLEVRLEVPLPAGRGSVDVVALGYPNKYIEVKSHPTSINQRGIQKQLERYQEAFPGQSYFVAFPLPDSQNIAIYDYVTKQKSIIIS